MKFSFQTFLFAILSLISSWGFTASNPFSYSLNHSFPNPFTIGYTDSVTYTVTNNLPFTMANAIAIDKIATLSNEFTYDDQCNGQRLNSGGICTVTISLTPESSAMKFVQLIIHGYDNNRIPIPALLTSAQGVSSSSHFTVIPLGTSGGQFDSNLSSYLISATQSGHWIALDAGTTCSETYKIGFSTNIQAYLLSHAHLDHISGLVICSPIDSSKNLYGLDTTINYLRDNIFNWQIWPNFADDGALPLLNQYHYVRMATGNPIEIPNTGITATPYPLSHGILYNGSHYPSTAFLLESGGYYFLYCGDTGADTLENSNDLQNLWISIAPLIQQNKLTAIFIEVSYTNTQPDNLLFGHLSPKWLLKELHALASLVNPDNPSLALKGLRVVITHIKYTPTNPNVSSDIFNYLTKNNDLGINFIIPTQGNEMEF
ncbi:MAG TPA: 3',5'-cyclic-nucleotide phosphodiesterase [Gammaproteobacteria bacterium]|nr:3',5'-cyclic-nucleotide phosphodiesterase [Gammaproteobacteria bacterium]